MISIYTDGACLNNPGPGGWACIILYKNKKIVLSGYKKNTTNNEMELMAIKESLLYFNDSKDITLYTDSKYAQNGITKWMLTWKNNNWTKKNGEIKNLYLWKIIYEMCLFHKVNVIWIKAHSYNKLNNEVDIIARNEIIKNNK